MTENERRFTALQRCPHCGIEAPMEIVGTNTRVRRDLRERDGDRSKRSGIVYELLSCPVCEEVTLRSDGGLVPQHQDLKDFQTRSEESTKRRPGLTLDSFKAAYSATSRFRKLDPVAYAALVVRLSTIRECKRHKRI